MKSIPSCAWTALFIWVFATLSPVQAQNIDPYDASWYTPGQTYVKVAVVQDGIYRLTGSDLATLGIPTSGIDPTTLQLLYKGREVPLHYVGNDTRVNEEAQILFVGQRNTGEDENWAYNYNPDWQSSTYLSLYSDTTYYWLTWGQGQGLQYRVSDPNGAMPLDVTTFRDTLHTETEVTSYRGDGKEQQLNPLYTRGEGTYFDLLSHTGGATEPIVKRMPRLTLSSYVASEVQDSIHVQVRINSGTPNLHRVSLAISTFVDGVRGFYTYDEQSWSGYAFQTLRATIGHPNLPNLFFNSELTSYNDDAVITNNIFVDWIEVVYTRRLETENGFLRFSYDEIGGRNFTAEGFGEGRVVVLDPADSRVYELEATGGRIAFSDFASTPPVYWAAAESAFRAPVELELATSTNLADPSNQADYIILTTPLLRSSAEALADYRRAQNGYQVMVVDVQDVYDQFDYGRPTPIAIRRFAHHTANWATPPDFLMLWGDTLYPSRTAAREAWDVPSFGQASGDGWFGMQSQGLDDWTEMIAIGRVPIRDNETGTLFLQKMMAYEGVTLDDWQKRIMLLVGGLSRNEQLSLQSLVLPWSNRAAAAPTGMDTLHFFSNTENPFGIEEAFQDSLRQAFIEGASWLTYFGHSATSTWDIVTDEPEDFNNASRLPIAISLGCQTGAFGGGAAVTADALVLGEKLVVGSLNGAIGHWGSSGLGTVNASASMGATLHNLVFSDTLRVAGKIFQEVKRQYATSPSFQLRDLLQYSYLGDPATTVNIPTRPEFAMAQNQIRITPATPIPADSFMTVTVQLGNQGIIPSDSIGVRLQHTGPDGAVTAYDRYVAPFRLTAQVGFKVPLSEALVGDNLFRVQVDPDNIHAEVNEANNSAERTHVVFSTQVTLLAPQDLGTVSSDTPPSFRVNYINQDPATTQARFQLDTVPTFDSPALQEFSTPASGSYATWTLDSPLPAGPTYYWRSGLEKADEPINWRVAAFTVQPPDGQHTWLQEGDLFGLNTFSRDLTHTDNTWDLGQYPVQVQYSSESGSGEYKGQFVVNGVQYERLEIGFAMLVLDGTTGAYRGSSHFPVYTNRLGEDPVAAVARLDSLVATVQEGDYVYVRTRFLGFAIAGEMIPDHVRDVFRSLGSSAIDTLHYGHLWLMRTRVGYPEETSEIVPTGTNEALLEETLYFNAREGQIVTPQIGPAQRWETLQWETALPNDASEVIVEVLDTNSDHVLLSDLTASPTDLSSLVAEDYPFIRLRATLRDSTQQATPQLVTWSVDYRTVPEIVVDPSSLVLSADTLNEAEPLSLAAKVLNLSATPADSVIVTLTLTDPTNTTSTIAADTLLNVAPDAEASVAFDVDTFGLIGENQLTVTARQPGVAEALTFNNTAVTTFTVRGDQVPPSLLVTVDGTAYPHDPDPIQDLQDPSIPQLPVQPTFEVVFSDENPFRLLTDTTLATITLDDNVIPFSSPEVQFQPATEAKNEARIIYTPDFTGENAVHTLRVTAYDVTGNEAEGSPYQFHFRIATTFEVGNIYPYPNPMSSFTRFAFQVKGADTSLIDDFRIRIYTLSGRVVQEFDLVENPSGLDGGQMRIGWNKLIWDGTDADGDLLAPGVYLYKVYLEVDGQEVVVNNETGIEKLVIIR